MKAKDNASDKAHPIRLYKSFTRRFNFYSTIEKQKLHRISVFYAEVRSDI